MTKKEKTIRLLGQGLTYVEIAERIGSTANSVRWYASKSNVRAAKEKTVAMTLVPREKALTKKEMTLQLFKRGMGIREIAKKTGSSVNSVRWYASKYKIKVARKPVPVPKVNIEYTPCPMVNLSKITSNQEVNDAIHSLAKSALTADTIDRGIMMDKLMRLLMPKLRFYIWKFFQNDFDTDDVLSNVLEKILVKFDTFNPAFRFTTWAFRIARNESLLYKYNRKDQLRTDFEESYMTPKSGFNGEDYIINELFADRIMVSDIYNLVLKAMSKLPHNINKKIIIDKRINNMKGREIATKYDMNVNTVKTKVKKMTDELKNIVQTEVPELQTCIMM